MKQAEKRAEEQDEEQQESKLKDLSEWKTSNAEKLKQKAQAKPKVIAVGFTALNSLNNGPPVIGRRTFGETKKEEKKPEQEQEGKVNDLDKLWQKQKEERSEPKSGKRSKDEIPKKTQNKKRKSTN